jgi:hypothetical protein
MHAGAAPHQPRSKPFPLIAQATTINALHGQHTSPRPRKACVWSGRAGHKPLEKASLRALFFSRPACRCCSSRSKKASSTSSGGRTLTSNQNAVRPARIEAPLFLVARTGAFDPLRFCMLI